MTNQKLKAHCEDVIANPQDHSEMVLAMAKELLALRKAFSEPVGTIEATCDYVTDVDWLQDIDSGEYLVIRKPTDNST